MKTRAVAFINFKGGVGKTASVVNIGACLAAYHEKKVLIVDLDPQSNSSLWLMSPEKWREHVGNKGKNSTYQIFHDAMVGTSRFDFEKAVVRGVPRNEEGYSLLGTLDLLPASIELAVVEDRIHQNRYAHTYEYLYKALKPYYDQYDYIFYDCPPNTYSVTKNGLFGADHCLVPYIPDYLSLSGFGILADQIEAFYERVSGRLTGKKKPGIAGLIVSHYRKVGNVFNVAINELEKKLMVLKEEKKVKKKACIFPSYIRHCTAVAESTNEHLPVILHNHNSIGALDYSILTQNIVTHLEETL